MRRICYISGARADFGLMRHTLLRAQRSGSLEISVCVTGAHLSERYGETVKEIESSGLRICGRVPSDLDGSTGGRMAKAIGTQLVGITDVLEREKPDLVLLLGDRGEMLAGVLAAIHLNIPVAHIHGGERSGTVDEPVRHAISKLSHFHLVATAAARERLVRMGERPEHVVVTGAPGLDGLKEMVRCGRGELCRAQSLVADRAVALVIFHPVLQEAAQAGRQMREIMEAVRACDVQALVFKPNSDAGGQEIGRVIDAYVGDPDVRVLTHLERGDFVSWMAAADVMVGNSSSGIIEAASLGLHVVNVGERQRYRDRSANTVDVVPEADAIVDALRRALAAGRGDWNNVYGDGKAADRIVDSLLKLRITPELLMKANAY